MIDRLKPYSSMKNPGVDWLAQVPAHWTLVPNRSMLTRKRTLVGNRHANYVLLSLTKAGVIIRDISDGRGKFSADMGTSQEVRRGDLVFCLFDVPETPRTVGLSRHDGMITGAYSIFECDDDVLVRFLEAFYIAMDDRKALSPLYSGLRNTIPPSRFLSVKTPVPPKDEQTAIVRFLAHADRRISRYIRAKQKLIALLEEQKQAIINQAVTGQIDVRTGKPFPAYKSTGVDWLEQIPEHWKLVHNRTLLAPRKVLVGENHAQYRLLSLTKAGIVVRDVSSGRGKFSADMGTSQEVRSGDLVFCLFDVPETPRTVGLSDHDGMITSAYTVFECEDPILGRFLEAFYIAMDDRKLLSPLYSGLRNTIPSPRFLAAKSPVPPRSEQISILDLLRHKEDKSRGAIAYLNREVELLNEYRARLIADVVTGKVDVRDLARRLPQPDRLEANDGLDENPRVSCGGDLEGETNHSGRSRP